MLPNDLHSCVGIPRLKPGVPPAQAAAWAAEVDGIEETQVFGATLRLRATAGSAKGVASSLERAGRRAGEAAVRARVVEPSLEDVFRFLVSAESISERA